MRAGPNPLPDDVLLTLLRLWARGEMEVPREAVPDIFRRLLAHLEAIESTTPGRPDTDLASAAKAVQVYCEAGMNPTKARKYVAEKRGIPLATLRRAHNKLKLKLRRPGGPN